MKSASLLAKVTTIGGNIADEVFGCDSTVAL